MNDTESTRIRPNETALATTIDGETVILETESGTYYGLNEVGTFVWSRLSEAEGCSLESIRNALLEKYDVAPAECEHDLEQFLEQMVAKDLLRLEDGP